MNKKSIFLNSLNRKCDIIIKNEIELLNGEKLNKSNQVIAKIAITNFIHETNKNKLKFIYNQIKKFDKNIICLIFIEIMKIIINKGEKNQKEIDEDEERDDYEDEKDIDFTEMKEFILDKFARKLDNMNDIDNIIKLIDVLEGKNENKKEIKKETIKNEFLNKLIRYNLFTKKEFFSNLKNLKIIILYNLYEKGKIQKTEEEYYDKISGLIIDIKRDIEEGHIRKTNLEVFLKNDEFSIKRRLNLIKIILNGFNPEEVYINLKKINEEINKVTNHLKYIKENSTIYHREAYQQIIWQIINIIENNERISIYKKEHIQELMNDSFQLKDIADKVYKVKDFLLFNVIYEINEGKDKIKKFDIAYNKLDEMENLINEGKANIIELYYKYRNYFDKIRDILSDNYVGIRDFIQKFISYFNINNENLIDELTLFFTCKKYELDINSIIYFFEYFQKDNKFWNNILSYQEYGNISTKDFQKIKIKLKELKDNGIYDYKNINIYNKFFTCLYKKKKLLIFYF